MPLGGFIIFKFASIALLSFVLTSVAQAEEFCANIDLGALTAGSSCQLSTGGKATLLAKTNEGKEVWKDEQSGIVWGDVFPWQNSFKGIQRKNICQSEAGLAANAFQQGELQKYEFTLATEKDFLGARDRGLFREVLSGKNSKHIYFMLGSHYLDGTLVYFDGSETVISDLTSIGGLDLEDLEFRCVGVLNSQSP